MRFHVTDSAMDNGVIVEAETEAVAAVKAAKKLGYKGIVAAECAASGAALHHLYRKAPRSTGADLTSSGRSVRVYRPRENMIADSLVW